MLGVHCREQRKCVHCRSHMHTTYECGPYGQFAKKELELKAGAHHFKHMRSFDDDAMEWRPEAGPLISSKRAPEPDSVYYYRKLQNDIPGPSNTARTTCFGQLEVVPIPKDDRMELRAAYPKPVDKPQVSEAQDSKGTWKYDAASWFSGWRFTMPKSLNMISSCIGLLIDPENDESFVG